MVKIIYKDDDEALFIKYWNEYVCKNIASYRYSSLYLDYMVKYASSLIFNKSFVVIEDLKCIGICFLPVEKHDKLLSITLSEMYTIAPLFNSEKAEKAIFTEIDHISYELDISCIRFYIDPLVIEYSNKFNFLRKYAYFDSSSSDCLIDLNSDIEKLWRNIRKSYRPLINGIVKNSRFDIEYIDVNNRDYSVNEEYRLLHRKCAGRETRPKSTFDKQFEMLCEDQASLFGLKYDGKFIGFNYFLHFNKTVVYYSGADDPKYENSKLPIYHPILWAAIKYYNKRGFDFMEFSQPCGYHTVSGFDDYLDNKQINISLFKRGLGGRMVPLFRGIKYFNKEVMLNDIDIFKENLYNSVQ